MHKPDIFRFLKGNEENDGVLDKYNNNEIRVIWDETQYFVFEKSIINTAKSTKNVSAYANFEKWYNSQKLKTYHEVIFGNNVQRIKFDIDSTPDEIKAFNLDIKDVIKTILSEIINELNLILELNNKSLTSTKEFIITDSSDSTKVSIHIISLYHTLSNYKEAKLFTKNVLKRLEDKGNYSKIIDSGINSSTHNFRILHSNKVGSNRVKRINKELNQYLGTSNNEKLSSYIIYPTPVCRTILLPDRLEKVVNENSYEDIQIPNEVLEYIKTNGFNFRNIEHNCIINCDRIRSSYCNICKRQHDNDNTLIIRINDGRYYEQCRHSNNETYNKELPNKSIRIIIENDFVEEEVENIKVEKPFIKKTQYQIIEQVIDDFKNRNNHEITSFESLPNKLIYDEPTMREYNADAEVIAILSQMGVGKTQSLKNFYNKNYKDKKVVFVSFRRTFSNSVGRIFDDFKVYSDITDEITLEKYNKLIIQVESLYKLHISEKPDLLILDEVESILSQFTSNLHKSLNTSFAVFSWLVKYSKKIIIMDANLTERTYNIIQNLRPIALDKIHLHWNTYKKASNNKYLVTNIHKDWLNQIILALKEDNKIVIATNNKTEADSLYEMLSKLYVNKKISIYTSNTPDSIKKLHFSNVNKYWMVDILIYSPCVSAGISFTEKHFDKIFMYMTDSSCDVESCRQMCARVRNIESNLYYICFKSGGESLLPTKVEDIKQLIKSRKSLDLFDIPSTNIEFQLTDSGQIEYYESPYFNLWINNISIVNLSKNNFIKRYLMQLFDSGATISMLKTNSDSAIESVFKDVKNQIIQTKQDNIINAEVIDDIMALELKTKMSNQTDLTIEEHSSYDKWKLAKHYDVEIDKINADFVKNYDNGITKENYRYINEILSEPTIEETLESIKKKDKEHYEYILEIKDVQARDLLINKNTYAKHKNAIDILNRCGFKDIFDKTSIPMNDFNQNLNKLLLHINKPSILYEYADLYNIKKINIQAFKMIGDKLKFNASMLKWINFILMQMYSIRISKKLDVYKINIDKFNKLFSFVESDKVRIMNNRV